MVKAKKIILRRTILDIPLLIFLGSQIISTIISIDQRTSIFGYYSRFNGGLMSTIAFIILYYALASNMDKEKVTKLIKITLISGSIVAVWGILEHFGVSPSCVLVAGKFDDACWVQDVRTRVFATLGQPNWLAAFLIPLVPLTYDFLLKAKDKKKQIIWAALSIIFFLCILFTKSRSGLLGLAAADAIFWIGTLAVNFKKKTFKKILTIFIAIHLIFATGAIFFGTEVTPSVGELLNKKQVTKSVDTSEGGTESGSIRQIVWKGAVNIWKAYPVFGTGVETFGYSYWQFRPVEHNFTSEWNYLYNKAHNEYLNFAANTGTIGLVAYLIVVVTIIYILRKNYALLGGFISILITNFFGFSVVVISLLTFTFPALALALESKPKKESNKSLTKNQKTLIAVIIGASLYALFLSVKYWYGDYLYQRGSQEYQYKFVENSIKDLQNAILLSPNEAIYHNQIAKVITSTAISLNDNNDATNAAKLAPYAINQSDIAFALSPRNMNIRQTKISVYLELSIFNPIYSQSAISLIRDTIPLSPTDPKIELLLGKAYANTGNFKQAIIEIKKALELKPDYLDAQKDLDIVLKLQDNKK